MKSAARLARSGGRGQHGASTVEFAVVMALFLMLLLGIMDFGRMLFAWNAAAEATRFGARIAVVCDKASAALVLAKMRTFLPQLTSANVVIQWDNPEGVADPACDQSNCKGVQVSIYNNATNPSDPSNFRVQAISPFMGFVMPPVPAFATYLPRESMQSASSAGDTNPVCQ